MGPENSVLLTLPLSVQQGVLMLSKQRSLIQIILIESWKLKQRREQLQGKTIIPEETSSRAQAGGPGQHHHAYLALGA